jgi:hypothetical protein
LQLTDTAPETVALHPGDLVQITATDHPWFPAVLVVDDVRGWGVQGFLFEATNARSTTALVFNRLPRGSYKRCGALVVMTIDMLKKRQASIEAQG